MNTKGGLAKGKSHKEGGIKATVKSTGQNIEFEGGEIIINKKNVADPTKLEFEGEEKTTCEILSDLNSRNNNGVTMDCDSVEGKKYKYAEGGEIKMYDEVEFEVPYFESKLKYKGKVIGLTDKTARIKYYNEDKKMFTTERELSSISKYGEGGEVDYSSWKKNKKKELFAKYGVQIANIIYPEKTLGIPREKMPQVRSMYMDDFLEQLQEDGINYQYVSIIADDLKPTQTQINLDKVSTLNPEYVKRKSILTSNDGYVLDGHHRWYWLKENNEKATALEIDMPINELMDYMHDYSNVSYAKIDSPNRFELGGSVEDKAKLFTDARRELVPKQQVDYLVELEEDGGADPLEARDMLINVVKAYQDIPKLYEQDGKGKNAVCYLHYFVGGTDWYITEWNRDNEFYGYVCLNGDWEMAEFGYIPKEYLIDNDLSPLNKPELDFYWKYKTINQILEKEYPQGVQAPIERYEPQENKKEEGTVLIGGTDWQSLIEADSFKNPFEKANAIEQMLDEKGEDPNNYSVIEKKFISEYTGIGGMEKYGAKQRDVGSGKDFDTGLLYEFFTPNDLCELMWGLAYKHIGEHQIKDCLEPSMGAGAFISQAPLNVNIDGYDINKYCYMINKILYTEERFKFYNDSFEKLFINKNKSVKDNVSPMYDLVIGNPPYGLYQGYYSVMGEKQYTKADNFIDYFIQRGLDLLRPNGLLVFVIGSVNAFGSEPFLDKEMTPSKSRIMAKSDLVDAYRLGRSMFEFTKVDADIIVLRKKIRYVK